MIAHAGGKLCIYMNNIIGRLRGQQRWARKRLLQRLAVAVDNRSVAFGGRQQVGQVVHPDLVQGRQCPGLRLIVAVAEDQHIRSLFTGEDLLDKVGNGGRLCVAHGIRRAQWRLHAPQTAVNLLPLIPSQYR